jgi:SAM-dependent methyltransferase
MRSNASRFPCPVCDGQIFTQEAALWPELIEEWRLEPHEVEYLDMGQGMTCVQCGSNLRAMTLALAVLKAFDFAGTFKAWTHVSPARVLEINHAHRLTDYTRSMKNHVLACYPAVDMLSLPYSDGCFDLVIHSDTLEHVPDPIAALAECRRVLVFGGFLAYTVPVVVGRLSRSRNGLPPSYHGKADANPVDYLVRTEFGSDFWEYAMRAGFTQVRLISIDYPASIAVLASR